jgi:hypothetical protein
MTLASISFMALCFQRKEGQGQKVKFDYFPFPLLVSNAQGRCSYGRLKGIDDH